MAQVSKLLLSAILCLSVSGVPALAQTKSAPADTKTTTKTKADSKKGSTTTTTTTATDKAGVKNQTKDLKKEAKAGKNPKGAVATDTKTPVKMQVVIDQAATSTTVKQGEKATVAVTTDPGAKAEISVKLKSGTSQNADLKPAKADAAGKVTWVWTVAKNTAPGPIAWTVNSTLKGKKASAEGVIKVEKSADAAAGSTKTKDTKVTKSDSTTKPAAKSDKKADAKKADAKDAKKTDAKSEKKTDAKAEKKAK